MNSLQSKGLDSGYTVSSVRDAAQLILDEYKHIRSKYIDIDYKAKDGKIFIHIFPRVPDYVDFFPDHQSFAKMLEKAVVSVIGTESQVYAEFCDEESLLDGQIQDRRMFTYYRKEDGSLTHLLFGELVPYVFIRVDRVFGFISLDELAARIAHAISRASDTSIYK